MVIDNLRKALFAFLVVCVCAAASAAQTATGTLRGQTSNQLGEIVVGATVTAVDSNGTERTATSDENGNYTIGGLTPGVYTVRASAEGFADFEATDVEIAAGRSLPLDIALNVGIEQQSVTVAAEGPVSTEPTNNQDAVVLRGGDLEALPDDPDELAAALQALAGPGAGPNGGQIFIDGFTGGRLPPKESIREIRINQNPFSSEYDRLGFGRVEILTRPGTDRFRGQAFFNFGDESLNSRNPFVIDRFANETKRPPYQQKRFGGNVSGSLIPKRASYFVDFERRQIDDNAVINARVLDDFLNPTSFQAAVITPATRTTFSPRFDYQINQNNTLVGRYSFARNERINQGINETSLPTLGFDGRNTQHTFQLTETAIIKTVVNETRFQFVSESAFEDVGETARPIVSVLDAFTAGTSAIGFGSRNPEKRIELQNFTSFQRGSHSLKIGARFRRISILDVSPDNFAGSFSFTGRANAPLIDANGAILRNADGSVQAAPIDALESYRRTVLLQRLNFSPLDIALRGGGAAQFRLNAGNPEARISQNDLGVFIQDDWRVNPELTLSGGLRYEVQSNINSNLNFAPRLAFAYAPGASNQGGARTVFRGGFGIFYDRFAENLSLQAIRFNGLNQQQYILNAQLPNAALPADEQARLNATINLLGTTRFAADGTATNIPAVADIAALGAASTLAQRVVSPDLSAPYTMQSGLSVERQLPLGITLTGLYTNTRTVHALRSRNVNAPRLVTNADGTTSLARPDATLGNVFQYESSGIYNQNQFQIFTRSRFGTRYTFFGGYTLNFAKSDTDSPNSFPADPYNLSNEYGRALNDVRHRLFMGGNLQMPFGINLNPFVIASSGQPFNITTGQDNNRDTQFFDRPTFDQLNAALAARNLTGRFKIDSSRTGTDIIPRNYGTGPAQFTVNLRAGRTFGFGEPRGANNAQGTNQGRGGRGGGGRGGRGGGLGGFGGRGGFGGGGFGGDSSNSRYNLNLSVQVFNLFNRANLGTPIGNLSSDRFGQSIFLARGFGFGGGGGDVSNGNRRVELQLRFSF